MLQLPHPARTHASGKGSKALPSDIPSLVAMFREANEAVTAATGEPAEIMNAATARAEPIYKALLSAAARSPQEEAQRLSCVADYCKEIGLTGDLEGYFEASDLYRIAGGLKKLTETSGADALRIVDKNIHPLKRFAQPSLNAELDRLENESNITAMVALYDYFVECATLSNHFSNLPRASSLDGFIEADNEHQWAKAYAVADRLKRMKPSGPSERDHRARSLINAAFVMGGNIREVAAIAQYLSEAGE